MKCILTCLTLIISLNATCQHVIPFELKEDNRIYIKVSVNQSDTLDFVFDLGASITVINRTRIKKNNVRINFDSTTKNKGTNSISTEEISTNNTIDINGNSYENIRILGIAYPQDEILDGIIGWNFFSDKVVKIDYESQKLKIYNELPELSYGYKKSKLKFIGNLPYIQICIKKPKGKAKIWAMVDIGYNEELFIYFDEVEKNELIGKFPIIGEGTTYGADGVVSKSDRILLPKFEMNDFHIYNMPANLTKTKSEFTKSALLGGNLLKRFHIVIDFPKKKVYMKPNLLINSQF